MRILGTIVGVMAFVAVIGFTGDAYGNDAGGHCDPGHPSFKGFSHPGCGVTAGGIEVEKTLTDGPYLFTIEGPLNLGARTDVAVDIDPNDQGGVAIGLTAPQHFAIDIDITNTDGGPTLEDLVVYDVIPAEFNLDPDGEDDADGTLDGTCADTVCNGIDLGAVPVPGCNLTEGQPAGAVSGPKDPLLDPFDQRFKEPELISILVDSLADDTTCSFTIYVVTDGNPGHVTEVSGNAQCIQPDDGLPDDCELVSGSGLAGQIMLFDLYEPGSCDLIGQFDNGIADEPDDLDTAVYDTVSLNDGIKVFEASDDLDDADGTDGIAEGHRLVGPIGSLQLTPNGENLGGCPNLVPVPA